MLTQKVAIYCRLSTDDEGINGTGLESESIQNQKLLLIDYAKKQCWEIYDIYSDADWSGLRDDRPAFLEMLSHAKAGDFSIILCKTQSRFTRNMETAERYLHHYFLLWNIRFVTVVDHVDTMSVGNKKARQINSLVNEWYSEEISDNIRAVFRRKMELGQFIGNYAPYGYVKDTACHNRLVVEEETAAVVRQVFQWYLEGLSCRKIAVVLTSRHIATPWQRKLALGMDKGRKNVANPGVWAESTIRKMLKNRVYIGDMVQGKERKVSFKDNKVAAMPQTKWIIVPQTHEAVVLPQVYWQVQERMAKKAKRGNVLTKCKKSDIL